VRSDLTGCSSHRDREHSHVGFLHGRQLVRAAGLEPAQRFRAEGF